MDALAAFSLAVNILQFLDFIGDAISKSRQIHASASGTLKEHDDLESLTTDLKDLSGRLQASTGPADLVLTHLCARCREVADELLNAVDRLGIKEKRTRYQSLRKALKALWGRKKLKSLEERLAGFRHELILHTTVELRSRIDVLKLQQTQSFQALDHATKESAERVLDVLQENRDHVVATTDRQTRHLSTLHAQTKRILNHEFESAAANLAEQSQTARTLTTKEHERSRTEVLNAIADAASGYDDTLSTEAENISARMEEGNEKTRAYVTEILDRNQETTMQEISGLRQELHQVELKIDTNTEELKEILNKINTTPEGPHRRSLREMGNSATVVLMSLHELYKALQDMLKSLAHRARMAFGTRIELRIHQSVIEDQPLIDLETLSSAEVDTSLHALVKCRYPPRFSRLLLAFISTP